MSNKPLTKRQIAVLSIMAGKAYKRIQSQGCPLPSLTDWRHDEVLAVRLSRTVPGRRWTRPSTCLMMPCNAMR